MSSSFEELAVYYYYYYISFTTIEFEKLTMPILLMFLQLVKDAIHAGIFNDLGSGSNVDITIVPLSGPTKVMRGYDTPNEQADLRGNYVRPTANKVAPGATAVLETWFEPLKALVTVEEVDGPMGL